MGDDQPGFRRLFAWISRAKGSFPPFWREMTHPASDDFIGIPHDDPEDRDRRDNRQTPRGEQMEIAEYYQWRHF